MPEAGQLELARILGTGSGCACENSRALVSSPRSCRDQTDGIEGVYGNKRGRNRKIKLVLAIFEV